MPRPNAMRAIYSEAGLARRLAFERSQRGMSLEGLAKRMTDVGCPIAPSAIYKIEKGDPPRRITVDELVAISKVLDLPIEELLLPPEVVAETELRGLFETWLQLAREASKYQEALQENALRQDEVSKRWLALVKERPELQGLLSELILEAKVFGTTSEELRRTAEAFTEAAQLLEAAQAKGVKRGKRQAKA